MNCQFYSILLLKANQFTRRRFGDAFTENRINWWESQANQMDCFIVVPKYPPSFTEQMGKCRIHCWGSWSICAERFSSTKIESTNPFFTQRHSETHSKIIPLHGHRSHMYSAHFVAHSAIHNESVIGFRARPSCQCRKQERVAWCISTNAIRQHTLARTTAREYSVETNRNCRRSTTSTHREPDEQVLKLTAS